MKTSERVCIIPARAGSKRLPGKNWRLLCDKPVLYYPIVAACRSGLFDRVVVSTDSLQLRQTLLEIDFGGLWDASRNVVLRKPEMAEDSVTFAQLLSDFFQDFEVSKWICLLLPTAALVTSTMLQEAFTLFEERAADEVMPVCRYPSPPQRALVKLDNDLLVMRHPEHVHSLSNTLEPLYHDAGAFYFIRREPFKRERKIILSQCIGYDLPEILVQDVDTFNDFELLRLKFNRGDG